MLTFEKMNILTAFQQNTAFTTVLPKMDVEMKDATKGANQGLQDITKN